MWSFLFCPMVTMPENLVQMFIKASAFCHNNLPVSLNLGKVLHFSVVQRTIKTELSDVQFLWKRNRRIIRQRTDTNKLQIVITGIEFP